MNSHFEEAEEKSRWAVRILAEVRRASGLTMQEVAKRLGKKSAAYVGDFEAGRYSRVSLSMILAFCSVYEVDLGFILTLCPPRATSARSLTKWIKEFDFEPRHDYAACLISGIETSEVFRARLAVAKALMEEYSHLNGLNGLGLQAAGGVFRWDVSDKNDID